MWDQYSIRANTSSQAQMPNGDRTPAQGTREAAAQEDQLRRMRERMIAIKSGLGVPGSAGGVGGSGRHVSRAANV